MSERAPLRVGTNANNEMTTGPLADRRALLERVRGAGIDHVFTADHVSFHTGRGMDGMIQAATLAASVPDLGVHIGVYLLALRHPVPVARQIAQIAESAPGRLHLGIGIGGEDRHEVEICGVDPKTRGRARTRIKTVVNPVPATNVADVGPCIVRWEQQVLEYEQKMEKRLDEDIKVGILVELAPAVVQDHIQLNTDQFTEYAKVRKCIFDYVEQQAMRHDADAMDVDILEAAGVNNILTKCIGSNNPHNVVNATMAALADLVSPEEAAIRRGIDVGEMQGRHAGTV